MAKLTNLQREGKKKREALTEAVFGSVSAEDLAFSGQVTARSSRQRGLEFSGVVAVVNALLYRRYLEREVAIVATYTNFWRGSIAMLLKKLHRHTKYWPDPSSIVCSQK